MPLKLGQRSLSASRVQEVIVSCEQQGRTEAADSFRVMLARGRGRVYFDELSPEQQEIVEWLESYGNRQS